MKNLKETQKERREFLKTSALVAGGVMMSGYSWAGVQSSVDDTIKIALIGCGDRGTGAAFQALSTKANLKLVAMADAFQDRLDNSYKLLSDKFKEKVDVPKERQFIGFDAYEKAIALADVVLLVTPPGFRPMHFEEAVKQGKHVFMEKPVAVDSPGIRKVLAAAEIAKQKKLNVVVGLQRRYQTNYREVLKRIQDGAVGDIVSGQVYWNSGGVWVKPRTANQTEMNYQMRNWYYFNWLCGDIIVEQHLHNIDVMNWFSGKYPVKVVGSGGRAVRTGKEYGEIFDHHCLEYTYDNDTVMNSQCRHWKDSASRVDEEITGTKGKVLCDAARIVDHKGKVLYQFDKTKENNPYQTEHDELFAAVAKGEYKFHDTERAAKSTLTAIMGRLATYSGQQIEWETALNSGLDIMPKNFSFDALPLVVPDADGFYPHAIPGKTQYFK